MNIKLPIDKPIGLGDVVKKATSAIGIKPCSSCEERSKLLNDKLQFTPFEYKKFRAPEDYNVQSSWRNGDKFVVIYVKYLNIDYIVESNNSSQKFDTYQEANNEFIRLCQL